MFCLHAVDQGEVSCPRMADQMSHEITHISRLIGEELASVCFVRDYVELHFDGPVLRIFGDVSVSNAANSIDRASSDFKNAICNNIGSSVSNVTTHQNDIRLDFDNGSVVVVTGRRPGHEFAHFISHPERRTQIWAAD